MLRKLAGAALQFALDALTEIYRSSILNVRMIQRWKVRAPHSKHPLRN
jgi:hypothetical protein